MDALFDSLNTQHNVTNAGVYESASMGVFSGGRITTKARVIDPTWVSLEVPSAKAGCGGIDMYGGSFSFINSDQIVQFIRTMAANAKGLIFKAALENVSPQLSTHLTDFQNIVQKMNDSMLNSCTFAEGLINKPSSTIDSGLSILRNASDLAGATSGTFSDFFASKTGAEHPDKTSLESVSQTSPEAVADITGNVLWKQFRQHNAQQWFGYTDDELLQVITSITGTVLVDASATSEGDSSQGKPTVTPIYGDIEIIKTMIFGGVGEEVKYWACSNDECDAYRKNKASITLRNGGLKSRIEQMLVGSQGNVGIIQKWRMIGSDSPLSNEEKNLIVSLPLGVGAILARLAQQSEDSAMDVARKTSGIIATEMTFQLIEQYMKVARHAMQSSTDPNAEVTRGIISQSEKEIQALKLDLIEKQGSAIEIIKMYNDISINLPAVRYTSRQSQ